MKKNFFKKLSFVLALAMLVSTIAPAAGAFAATATPKINTTATKYLFVGESAARSSYNFNVSNKVSGATYKFSTSDSSVATVDSKYGVVKAVKPGKVTITLTATVKTKKYTTKCTVAVYENIDSLTIDTTKLPADNKVLLSQSTQFATTYTTFGGNTSGSTSVVKYFVNKAGASITEDGLFSATVAGTYTVTAKAFQSTAKYTAWKALNKPTSTAGVLASDSYVVTVEKDAFKATVTAATNILEADGASSTLVTFKLLDPTGVLVASANDAEVAFTTTFGNFAEKRVTVQNGIATVVLTSEFLTSDQVAKITATVVESKTPDYIGIKAETTVTMSPNPSTTEDTWGVSLSKAEASGADRVVLYFNKDVAVSDFIVATTGAIDTTKALVFIENDRNNDGDYDDVVNGWDEFLTVRGLKAVEGNKKALVAVLETDGGYYNTVPAWVPDNTEYALTDNTQVSATFVDLRGTLSISKTVEFKLTDSRGPALLSVAADGLRKLKVSFSEPVNTTSIGVLANWSIDGYLLSDAVKWGAATIAVGEFNSLTGVDERNLVTITLGAGKYLPAGGHSIQAAKVGDWAALTDSVNIMNTQTLDFTIQDDPYAPVATVEVQSPEQWLVSYDKEVFQDAAAFRPALQLQKYNSSASAFENDYTPLLITQVSTNPAKFLVEVQTDWTIVHTTSISTLNYFNFNYRLKLAANAVTNVANGKNSAEQALTLGGYMNTPDVTSPTITKIEASTTVANTYIATLSEPVKLSTVAGVVTNNEGSTLAETQSAIPVVTASFIRSDNMKTIGGTILPAFADSFDTQLQVQPASALDAGYDWILVIRSISDDIGNTAPSATGTFKVAGTTAASTAFKVLWSFADVDKDLAVEAIDATESSLIPDVVFDDDQNYDYVFVKFSKAVAITGDYKNALKTSNYLLDGNSLPLGSQILSNIAGYDDLDATVDSVTIRLPQGTLQSKNAPHVVNVSSLIESTTAGETVANAGEKVLPYELNAGDIIGVGSILSEDLLVRRNLVAGVAAVEAAMNTLAAVGGMTPANIDAFVATYNLSKTAIEGLDNETTVDACISYVRAQYLAAIDGYKNAVKSITGFAYGVTAAAGTLTYTAPNSIATSVFNDATKFSVTNTAVSVLTFDSATGAYAAVAGTSGIVTISITDKFWGVTDSVTFTVVNGAITNTVAN